MDLPRTVDNVLAQPTRARLFEYLTSLRAPAGTDELAGHFGLHPNGVRRHLERLETAGLVERRQVRAGRGRPRDIWSVAAKAEPGGLPPRSYADLSRWLARAMPSDSRTLSEIEQSGREIGQELLESAPSGDPAQGFRDAVAALGFQPSLERDSEGFSCRLGNCPFSDTVSENTAAICTLHRGITTGMLKQLDPDAKLARFEARDPKLAGCTIVARSKAGAG